MVTMAIARHPGQGLWLLLLMWCPGVSSFIGRMVLRESWADVSFRIGGHLGVRALAIGYAVPLAIGGVAYGMAWAAGLAHFTGTLSSFTGRLGLAGSLGLVDGVLGGLGEELGWRGYMLTRLVGAGVPVPLLTSGLIWALWHLPLVMMGAYPPVDGSLAALPAFLVVFLGAGAIAGILRLRSGSIWPAVMFHAAWDGFMQIAFDPLTAERTRWLGEGGVLVAIATVGAAVWVARWSGVSPMSGAAGMRFLRRHLARPRH